MRYGKFERALLALIVLAVVFWLGTRSCANIEGARASKAEALAANAALRVTLREEAQSTETWRRATDELEKTRERIEAEALKRIRSPEWGK